MHKPLDTFAKTLLKFRKNKGLSQEQLAELADLHRTYVSGLERAQRNPTLTTLARIAQALSVKTSELVAGVENE